MKDRAIKNAYGESYELLKDHIDLDNGYCTMYDENNIKVSPNFIYLGFTHEYVSKNIDSFYDPTSNKHFWRPKELEGIHDNNGWNIINSPDDLPKETIACHVDYKGHIYLCTYVHNGYGFFHATGGQIIHKPNAWRAILMPKKRVY